jgi:hypothetical protein
MSGQVAQAAPRCVCGCGGGGGRGAAFSCLGAGPGVAQLGSPSRSRRPARLLAPVAWRPVLPRARAQVWRATQPCEPGALRQDWGWPCRVEASRPPPLVTRPPAHPVTHPFGEPPGHAWQVRRAAQNPKNPKNPKSLPTWPPAHAWQVRRAAQNPKNPKNPENLPTRPPAHAWQVRRAARPALDRRARAGRSGVRVLGVRARLRARRAAGGRVGPVGQVWTPCPARAQSPAAPQWQAQGAGDSL